MEAPAVTEAPEGLGIGPVPASQEGPKATPEAAGFLDPAPQAPEAPASPSTDTPGQTSGPAPIDWGKIDIRRIDVDKDPAIPPERREEARAIQQQVRRAQGDRNREIEENQRYQDQIRTQGAQIVALTARIEALSAAERSGSPRTAEVKEEQKEQKRSIDAMLAKPDLDDETKEGLLLIKEEMDARDRRWEERFKKAERVAEAYDRTTRQEKDAEDQAFRTEILDAVKEFGVDANGRNYVDVYQDRILREMGIAMLPQGNGYRFVRVAPPVNDPITGEPPTVKSLMSLYLGRTAAAAAVARKEDEEARAEASAATSTPSPSAPEIPGSLSEAEARKTLRTMGFGKG